MKTLLLLSWCIVASLAFPGAVVFEKGVQADDCTSEVCKADDGCRCATSTTPLNEQIPQLISLTFDEAVTNNLYNQYWSPLLFSRQNPDGQPIGATFFVPHEYTDYQRVNDLYNFGFEIAVHSVTKSNLQSYWRDATEDVLEQEFGGQREIISKYANIPIEDIVGVRTPQLQLAGNASIQAYVASGLLYDSSWPTVPDKPLFPYTLDYLTSQQCNLGSKCPNEAFDGFWILPINDLNGEDRECNTLASCDVTGTADEIADWLTNEINSVRSTHRQPLTLLVNSYWFNFTDNSLEGFTKFLDNMADLDDVFLVSQKEVYDWIKNPVPLSEFKSDFPENNANCNSYSCSLKNVNNEDRHMESCVPCPQVYPWLGNPNGDQTAV